jgi:UDP-N-acetylmuramate dehydrogenase
MADTETKVAAGWLIDNAGLKGYRKGDAGVHENQALVLVNYNNASGQDIINLSELVQEVILEKYGISIEAEVNFI